MWAPLVQMDSGLSFSKHRLQQVCFRFSFEKLSLFENEIAILGFEAQGIEDSILLPVCMHMS